MDIKAYLREKKALVDSFLESYFSSPFTPRRLQESMLYSLSAGGKRIRPILCLSSYEACGGNAEDIIPFASALELIHTYSLIHDDLPAMDDDDLRRGKPTNHKVFGEGMAILAGDGLLTEAFYLIADYGLRNLEISPPQSPLAKGGSRGGGVSSSVVIKVIREIARGAGIYGMVGGQTQDLLSENAEPDPATLTFIHTHKTAALIEASIKAGGILAGCEGDKLSRLESYGENIGLAFQVVDDILDVEGNTEVLGKPKGSDEKKKKMTYPRLYGIEKSKDKAGELVNNAIKSLDAFAEKAEPLRAIAGYLLERKS